jgi:hypothetical protein
MDMLFAHASGQHQLLDGGRRYLGRGRLSSFRWCDGGGRNPQQDAVAVQHLDVAALGTRPPRPGRYAEPPAVQRMARIGDRDLFLAGAIIEEAM